MSAPPWLWPCHTTLTPAWTPRPHYNGVMRCIVMWGLSSAMLSCYHNSSHPPEMEMNPPKMACGCPCGEVIKKKVTHSIECLCQCTVACAGDSPENSSRKPCNSNNNNCSNNNNNSYVVPSAPNWQDQKVLSSHRVSQQKRRKEITGSSNKTWLEVPEVIVCKYEHTLGLVLFQTSVYMDKHNKYMSLKAHKHKLNSFFRNGH